VKEICSRASASHLEISCSFGKDRLTCLVVLICFLAVNPSAPRVKAAAANEIRKKVLSLLASDC
jgi:hypothetical protein